MTCAVCSTTCPPSARHCPNCGAPLSTPLNPVQGQVGVPSPYASSVATFTAGGTTVPLAPGTRLQGRYRIERVLGSGAFGRVYLATDTQDATNPSLAIKELLDHQFASPADKREAITWFKREVSTLLTLEHPGIPAIYGYWTAHATAGPFYLVMDYIPGQTLQQVLQDTGGRVAWPQVVTWGIALGEVLAYLHSRTPPVIFRDMKPPNVMLDNRTHQPMLIDFGIARQLAQAGGTTIGTPGYAPYEQWLGRAEPRSDLYALGAMVHTLLTSRNPEAEYTRLRRSGLDVEGAMRVLFPPVDTLVPAVPTALAQALVRATAFDRDDRYPDVSALVSALQALVLPGGPTSSVPAPPVAGPPTLVVSAAPAAGSPTLAVSPAPAPAPPVATTAALPTHVIAAVQAPPATVPQPAIVTSHGGQRRSVGRLIRPVALALASIGLLAAGGVAGLMVALHASGPQPHRRPAVVVRPTPTLVHTVPPTRATARPTPTLGPTIQETSTPVPNSLYVDAVRHGILGVDLRRQPSVGAPIALVIPGGVRVQVSGNPISGRDGKVWYAVVYRSTRGYVLGSLLSPQSPQPPIAMSVNAAGYAYTGVYLRERPSEDAGIIIGFNNGERIRVLPRPVQGTDGENWYIMLYRNKIGYVRSKLLSPQAPEPPTPRYVDAASYGYTGIDARARPDMNAEVRFGVKNGGRVDAVGQPVAGDNGEDWDIVEYRGNIGYAPAKLLNSQPPDQTMPDSSAASGVPTATAVPADTSMSPTVVPDAPPDVPDGLTPDEQSVSDAVVQSNTAWTAAMQNASADGLENVKTGDSLQQTQAAVAALQQQGQHWEIHLRRLQVKWIHLFRPDYAQALVLKDEYRAVWDNGASAPRQEWNTPYVNLYGVRLIGGRWLVSTVDTAAAATGNENVDTSAQGDPADPVRSFYDDVAAHDYAAGYALFSDDLKSRLPDEAAWAHQFDNMVTTHVTNSEVVYRDAILTAVTIRLASTFATAGGQETGPYVGTWLLHYEHDSWRLDHVVVVSGR